jgi:hypothetical protein
MLKISTKVVKATETPQTCNACGKVTGTLLTAEYGPEGQTVWRTQWCLGCGGRLQRLIETERRKVDPVQRVGAVMLDAADKLAAEAMIVYDALSIQPGTDETRDRVVRHLRPWATAWTEAREKFVQVCRTRTDEAAAEVTT